MNILHTWRLCEKSLFVELYVKATWHFLEKFRILKINKKLKAWINKRSYVEALTFFSIQFKMMKILQIGWLFTNLYSLLFHLGRKSFAMIRKEISRCYRNKLVIHSIKNIWVSTYCLLIVSFCTLHFTFSHFFNLAKNISASLPHLDEKSFLFWRIFSRKIWFGFFHGFMTLYNFCFTRIIWKH